MVDLTINKERVSVKRLSELSFKELNEIILEGEALTFPEYLSFFCKIDKDELLNAEYKGKSLTSVYAQIFNVNIEKVVKDNKETIRFRDKVYLMRDLSVNTFGKNYMIDLKRKQMQAETINRYEFSLYVLACGLSQDRTGEDIPQIYKELKESNWMEVLPQGFFLNKSIAPSRIKRAVLSLNYTLRLRWINLTIIFYLRKLRKLERNY